MSASWSFTFPPSFLSRTFDPDLNSQLKDIHLHTLRSIPRSCELSALELNQHLSKIEDKTEVAYNLSQNAVLFTAPSDLESLSLAKRIDHLAIEEEHTLVNSSLDALTLELPAFLNIGSYKPSSFKRVPIDKELSPNDRKLLYSKSVRLITSKQFDMVCRLAFSPLKALGTLKTMKGSVYLPTHTRDLVSWFFHHNPSSIQYSHVRDGTHGIIASCRLTSSLEVAKKTFKAKPEHAFSEGLNYMKIPPHKNILSLLAMTTDKLFLPYVSNQQLNEQLIKLKGLKKGSNADLNDVLYYPSLLSTKIIRTIFLGVASAVEHLHNHRFNVLDLKPSNILLDEHMQAKLCDLGAIKPCDETLDYSMMQPFYSPPESLHPLKGSVSPKVDTWSYGISFFDTLTAQTDPFFPYSFSNPTKYKEQVYKERFLKPCSKEELLNHLNIVKRDILKILDPENLFISLIAKCLHGDAEKRPTMTQVREKLETFYTDM